MADNTSCFLNSLCKEVIASSEFTENIFISPISLYAAANCLLSASSGVSEKELKCSLGYNESMENNMDLHKEIGIKLETLQVTSEEVVATICNNLFNQRNIGVKPSFELVQKKAYNTKTCEVDFINDSNAAVEQINNLVCEETHEKIKKAINASDVDSDTRIILVNTTYFRGAWARPFMPSTTMKRDFFINDEKKIEINMMKEDSDYFYKNDAYYNCQVLSLKFKNNDCYSFTIVLPNEKFGLKNLVAKVSADKEGLSNVLFKGLTSQHVEIEIPKCKIEFEINMNDVFKKLGCNSLFNNEADFTRMTDEKIVVSKIVHKTVLDVNESGVEAAAFTGAICKNLCAYLNSPKFICNHPYLVSIVNESLKEVIFIGAVVDPSKA